MRRADWSVGFRKLTGCNGESRVGPITMRREDKGGERPGVCLSKLDKGGGRNEPYFGSHHTQRRRLLNQQAPPRLFRCPSKERG